MIKGFFADFALASTDSILPFISDQFTFNLEAERRCCADGKIVTYVNSNFYPINVADITTGTTTTARVPFNPLCGCCNPCM